MWIEFGRIKLPQGYHPNDVEEEWGKLIIEMLEREKSLRPAVERLVLNQGGAHGAHRTLRGKSPCPSLHPLPPTPAPREERFSLIPPVSCHRLELLLQIANKIQNGALSCEEKLTLAKNTLQAVSVSASVLISCCALCLFSLSWGPAFLLSFPLCR